MIRRLPQRATSDPVVTPVGLPGGSVPVFWASRGAGKGLACASRGSVGMLLLALILPGWLSPGMPPARRMSPDRDGDSSARSTLCRQGWAWMLPEQPRLEGDPVELRVPPGGPLNPSWGAGRTGGPQGTPVEPQDGGKASNPAEGSARRSPLWIRNCVMASDPRNRGCPLPWVSPARPGRLEEGAAGQGGLRGSAGGSERFY